MIKEIPHKSCGISLFLESFFIIRRYIEHYKIDRADLACVETDIYRLIHCSFGVFCFDEQMLFHLGTDSLWKYHLQKSDCIRHDIEEMSDT